MGMFLDYFLTGLIVFCSLLIFLCLLKAVTGPTIPDRLIAVNMIGTQVIIIIAVLTVFLGEAWLADVAVVYALLSFLGVVVLTKIYIGVYRRKHTENRNDNDQGDEAWRNKAQNNKNRSVKTSVKKNTKGK